MTDPNLRPKRRYIIITDFITACIEENTLLDESGTFHRWTTPVETPLNQNVIAFAP
jgi:hypothetical protein